MKEEQLLSGAVPEHGVEGEQGVNHGLFALGLGARDGYKMVTG